MISFKKWLRRLRTLLWTALTLITVLAAVFVGVGKLLMPYSVQYKPQLEAWLSREFNQPVQVGDFTGEWKAFGPRISLEGVHLMGDADDAGEIAIQHAALDIKPLNLLLPGRPLYTFRIIGADLALVRKTDGRFELSGLGVSGRGDAERGGSGLGNLARVGEVRLEDSNLSFDDDGQGIHAQLTEVNGRLRMDGRGLALEVQASISDRRRAMVLGDLGVTLLVTLNDEQRLAEANWHVQTGEVMASELGKQLPEHDLKPLSGWLNAEVWGSWSPGSPQRMEGVLDIREAQVAGERGPLQLEHLNTRFRWTFSNRRQWRLDLAGLRVEENGRKWDSPRLTVERNIPGGLGIWVAADSLRAEFPLEVTRRAMATFNARWPRHVPRAGRGLVRDFDLVIDSNKVLTSATGEFQDLEVLDWGRWPRMFGLNGRIDLAFGGGSLHVNGEQVRVEWERNFRSPALVDIPACEVEILWTGKGGPWQVDARSCEVRNDFIDLQGRLRFAGNEGKPAMDINVIANRARLDALDDYWPASIVKPKVADWLRRGLVAGALESARFVMRGDMDDWPFRGGTGTIEAHAKVTDAVVDYYPGWPVARDVDATVTFKGVGMEMAGSAGSIGGPPVAEISARIVDFQAPELQLRYATATGLDELRDFIRQTPLLEKSELNLDNFAVAGPAAVSGQLTVPLRANAGGPAVQGTLELANNGFEERRSGVRLENISGAIDYDRDGFRGDNLQAFLLGRPGRLAVAAEWDAREVFRTTLEGEFPASMIVAESTLADDPLLARVVGESAWVAELLVTAPAAGEAYEIWLELKSDLRGTAIELPPPLSKPAEEPWPVTLHYPVRSATPIFTGRFDGRLSIAVETTAGLSGARRASVRFGVGTADMPPNGQFTLAGHVATLHLDEWIDLIAEYFDAERYAGGLEFGGASLTANELLLLNRRFPAVEMELDFEDDVLRGRFDSERLAGEIRYRPPSAGAHSLAAEMERLWLPEPETGDTTVDTDPAGLPEVHIFIEQFGLMGLELGETRIEAYPIANGLHVESLEAKSPYLNFQARGDWILEDGRSHSDFDIVLTSESLGTLVEALELSSVLEGGQTMIRYDASWPGPPAAFALARLNGEMRFSVIDGKIRNADPGAGRMLGLLSVSALPRRLAFDFRDVFESGFSFDQASGTIELEGGMAHTEDFVMESTAAQLAISGESDLENQRFDYELTVRPGVSQTLPVLGAIAAGPGGAAAGLALQGLLRDALGDAAEARYRITGPWAEPDVRRIELPVTVTQPAEAVTEQEEGGEG